MSDHHGRRDDWETLSDEVLEEILRQDAQAPKGRGYNSETIGYVMEELVRRRRARGTSGKTAQESWEPFRQNYLPRKKPVKKQAGLHRWMCGVAAAAAALVLFVSIPTQASGSNLRKTVATWTTEQFY